MSLYGARGGSFMAAGPNGGFVAGSRGAFVGGGVGGGAMGSGVYPGMGYAGGGVYPGTGYAGGGEGCCGGVGCGNSCGADGCGVGVAPACGDACCGVAGASCGGIAGTTMSYVGAGGDYIATTTYQYVGQGAGTFTVVPIPAAGCSVWWLCCLWWLALLPFLFLAGTTTTTTTTPPIIISTPPPETPPPIVNPTPAPPGPGPAKHCKIFGDPHVITFDGQSASFYSQGEYWTVKSTTVWIQGRYMPTPVTNGLSVMKEVAIGGPFLESKDGTKNILRISSLSATFNDVPIILASRTPGRTRIR
ncbi:unnamed protein product [Prorocentrum cordatum]|uniref:VWFD domain-containing protein n=1 Tax=Prorocentrum cordatum TaxID=2364126 RepID=A0ABN9V710_9DINO|nr:unnamed protein product [Polarella glacialis]CAK0873121.1 unnamed protein product [Polarella glacialis]